MSVHQMHVSGYRSIRDVHLELGTINVLVGPNGCGKTNLYRSLYLLTAAAGGTLARTLADEGGMPSVLWAGSRTKGPVRLTVGVSLDDFAYEISCGLVPPAASNFDLDPQVKEEHVWALDGNRKHVLLHRKDRTAFLRDANGAKASFPTTIWSYESVLSQLAEPHRFPVLSELRSQFLSWRFYHHFRTDLDAPLRQPQIGIRTPVLSHDGRDLAAALQTIVEIGDRKALVSAIERAFPGCSLEVVAQAGSFTLQLRTPGVARPLDARELSDGTLRYLCLVAALLSPRPPALLALNEPETSLHPDLLSPLAHLLADAARQSQVWVTTHSTQLASELEKLSGVKPVFLEKLEAETQVKRRE